jgi:hypothetical protein
MVFIIQAYEGQDSSGKLLDFVELQLIDKSADTALLRAQKLIHKKHYRVASVLENYVKN